MAEHPNYDAFWKARNLLPHLRNVAPAVMTVGGWFDAEDLYGALNTYRAVEKQNPKIFNVVVMGPWSHGGWARRRNGLGDLNFGGNTSAFFQKEIELPFFNQFLKGKGETPSARSVHVRNRSQPLAQVRCLAAAPNWRRSLFTFRQRTACPSNCPRRLAIATTAFPVTPTVPFPIRAAAAAGMVSELHGRGSTIGLARPDVLVYQGGVLTQNLTLAGPLKAELFVSTSGTDSDWIVKLIDVQPGGKQVLIRSEVIRGRFRNSYEKPEPFVPNQPAKVSLKLQDVLHTFAKDHRVMVQICSTWFPLVDRNPQKFVPNIFQAEEGDFIKTTQRVYRSAQYPSCIQVGILK